MQGFGNLSGNKWFPLFDDFFDFGAFFNPEVTKMGNIILITILGQVYF
jgi:hypothetical protein